MQVTRPGAFLQAVLLFLLLFSLAQRPTLAAGQAMIEPHAQAMPLLPFLDYIVDPGLGMDIEEASRASGWQPFILDRLPRQEGILWLRFTIAPLGPDARPRTFLLDMGESVPGSPILFDPYRNELSGALEWRENTPGQRNILLLPEAGPEAIPCYIRMDGLPGPWFAPMIRTPQNAASNWGSLARNAAILALAVVMFICLLRGVSEKGQWRYWTALFVAVALLQALLGMPTAEDSFSLKELAAVLAPGIALMLMPHVGRHLMRTKEYSRSIDIQLFLLGFVGAALAILPLVPGWNWLYRWLDLWPVSAIIFVPTALGAWILAIPGARRFLLACVIPPAFVIAALFGLDFGLPANVLASGPTWGVAIAALLMAATKSPLAQEKKEREKPARKSEKREKKGGLPPIEMDSGAEDIINLEHPLDDPNLRIIPPVRERAEAKDDALLAPEPVALSPTDDRQLENWENALREPLDAILRDASALERCSLAPSARQYAENVIAAAHAMAGILSAPHLPAREKASEKRDDSFNLQHILRGAHDAAAPGAEAAGIALSWYMPPHLPQIYRGDSGSLETTLTMLLESSVRAAHHGAIKISAKRVPDSSDPGHLLFTITDDGNGYPPLDRSSLALARAWELTGEFGGYLSVECSQHGATIAFTAHFAPVDEENVEERSAESRILMICDDETAMRQLGRIIETGGCQVGEARSAAEAIGFQSQNPATLAICRGKFARPAAADMVRQLVRIARQAGTVCHALALTADEREWPLLKASGFTHAMLEPVDPDVLRAAIMDLTKRARDADTPYYEETTSLDGNARASDEEHKPKISAGKSYSAEPLFEGPDWLGHSGEEDGAVSELESMRSGSAVSVDADTEKNIPSAGLDAARTRLETDRAPDSMSDWVGEPMPMETAPQREEAARPVEKETPGERLEEKFRKEDPGLPGVSEWVGEPVPILAPKPRSTSQVARPEPQAKLSPEFGGAQKADFNENSQAAVEKREKSESAKADELLDFIVGVNGQEKGDVEKNGTTVRNFVEGSVNMVAMTLSNMLRKQKQPDAPPEAKPEPEGKPDGKKSGLDPVIVALLDRIEAALRRAHAAYAAENGPAIVESTGLIASDAEKFGLRSLARLAKCVEKAADKNDMTAVADFLPELAAAVERNRIALTQKKSGMGSA